MKSFVLSLILLISFQLKAQIQKSHWELHPNVIDFTTSPISSSSSSGNTFSYTAGNSAYDENGNLLFYVQDQGIYDASNSYLGSLSTYYSAPPGHMP